MLVESLSGVRGWYGRDLTPNIAQRYAAAYASSLMKAAKGKRLCIVIGMDTRPSGPALKDAMLPFLPADIIDVGVLPAPAIEHAVRHFRADGGIIITASHNEPQFGALLRLFVPSDEVPQAVRQRPAHDGGVNRERVVERQGGLLRIGGAGKQQGAKGDPAEAISHRRRMIGVPTPGKPTPGFGRVD